MKKFILALVAFVLFISVFPTTVFANGTEYEPRLAAPERSNDYYNKTLNRYSQTGYGMPNCVAYAYGRVYEMNDEKPLITRGSAGDWWGINKRGGYYEYGTEPKLGAVAVWNRHVAVVEEVHEDGSFTVSESHYRSTYFNTKRITSAKNSYGQRFYGFIYTYNEPEPEEKVGTTYKMEKSMRLPSEKTSYFTTNLDEPLDEDTIVHNSKMLLLAIS